MLGIVDMPIPDDPVLSGILAMAACSSGRKPLGADEIKMRP
jgi:hypothetical protein